MKRYILKSAPNPVYNSSYANSAALRIVRKIAKMNKLNEPSSLLRMHSSQKLVPQQRMRTASRRRSLQIGHNSSGGIDIDFLTSTGAGWAGSSNAGGFSTFPINAASLQRYNYSCFFNS